MAQPKKSDEQRLKELQQRIDRKKAIAAAQKKKAEAAEELRKLRGKK